MLKSLTKAGIQVRTSLWVVPGAMFVGAIAIATGLTALDTRVDATLLRRWPALAISPEGARATLAAVATSVITVAGVVFSITVVALTLAANQYSPRVLRSFMQNTGNRVVVGYFVSVFTYCLLVLRTVQTGRAEFVPVLAAHGGMVFGIVSAGFLIYFVNHIAVSLTPSYIVSTLAEQTVERLSALMPLPDGAAKQPRENGEDAPRWPAILAAETGYIQSVDVDRVSRAALQYRTVVWLEHPVGGFAIAGAVLARSERGVTPDLARQVNDAVVMNHYRTLEQDPLYGIRQIVDIAVKSLSAGINDTTTAATCVDYLTSILVYLAGRAPESCRHYHGDVLCAITRGVTFEAAIDEAFHEIRQNTRDNVEMALRQLESLERLAGKVSSPERRQLVLRHARLVEESAREKVVLEHDREVVRTRLARVAAAVEEQAQ